MKINDLYPSKYIKAEDLPANAPVTVTIRTLTIEDLGEGQHKPGLYFVGKEKGFILNKTNALIMAVSLGDESDAWLGKKIELFVEMKQFQGKLVQGISVRVPAQAAQAAPLAPAAQAMDNLATDIKGAENDQQAATAGEFDDIPF